MSRSLSQPLRRVAVPLLAALVAACGSSTGLEDAEVVSFTLLEEPVAGGPVPSASAFLEGSQLRVEGRITRGAQQAVAPEVASVGNTLYVTLNLEQEAGSQGTYAFTTVVGPVPGSGDFRLVVALADGPQGTVLLDLERPAFGG